MTGAMMMTAEDSMKGTGSPVPRSHIPVMLREAVEALNVQRGGRYVDCTLGAGGHALAILEASAPGGQLLGIDADPESLEESRSRLAAYSHDVLLVNDNFSNLRDICLKNGFAPVHGILFDFGLSSRQLDASDRGFSFQRDAELDMRFSPGQHLTAADILNNYSESELADLLFMYGEERNSRRIARQVVARRPLRTTAELIEAVSAASGTARGRIHPATRVFQALRIAVNDELSSIRGALAQALDVLGHGGRLVTISYHSLEDRIVKDFMRQESRGCICPPETPQCICGHSPRLSPVTRKVVTPSYAEIAANPRSRSARLRAAERILLRPKGD